MNLVRLKCHCGALRRATMGSIIAFSYSALGHFATAQADNLAPAPAALSPAGNRLDPSADPPQAEPAPVEREYDRFQDKTTIKVEGIRPTITRGESRLFINITSSYDGIELSKKPEKVAINLLAVSDEFQFVDLKDNLQLILLINGNRVRVPAKFIKAGVTKDRAQKSLETFVAILDADVLVQMATATGIEAQLGGSEFKLGPVEQLSLRKFAETVKLLAPLPKTAAAALDSALAAGPVRPDAIASHLAQARIDEAQAKVDLLTAACIAQLEKSDDYINACEAAVELEAAKDKTPAGPQRADISRKWLEAKGKVGLIKSSALLEDAELATARRNLADAQSALRASRHSPDRGYPSVQR